MKTKLVIVPAQGGEKSASVGWGIRSEILWHEDNMSGCDIWRSCYRFVIFFSVGSLLVIVSTTGILDRLQASGVMQWAWQVRCGQT